MQLQGVGGTILRHGQGPFCMGLGGVYKSNRHFTQELFFMILDKEVGFRDGENLKMLVQILQIQHFGYFSNLPNTF